MSAVRTVAMRLDPAAVYLWALLGVCVYLTAGLDRWWAAVVLGGPLLWDVWRERATRRAAPGAHGEATSPGWSRS